MVNFIQKLLGVIVACCGVGMFALGVSLLLQQPSWTMLSGFIVLSTVGLALVHVGYALVRGSGVREALALLFFIGRRTPQ